MTAKYFANSAKYQITLNRKEAEALAYYGSSYDYLITVMADLNRALAASRN